MIHKHNNTSTLKALPEPPIELNPEAKNHYSKLGKILIDNNLFFEGDIKAFCRLCHLYSMADKLEAEMNKAWSNGLVKSSLTYYDKLLKNILALESSFQLNPASRTRGKVSLSSPRTKGFNLSERRHEKV